MDYSVRSHLFGKKEIVFKCDRCHDELKAPLEDAGTQQACPNCGNPFITPAVDELHAEQEEQRRREVDAKNLELAAAAQKDREARRRQEELQLARSTPPPPQELVWYGAMSCNSCGYQWQARRQTPPARCPSCGKRDVQTVKVPKRTGCLVIIAILVPAALFVATHAWS
jgi:rubrerythrin